MIQDKAEGIEEIVWRVDGKVKKVNFTSVSGKNNLEFDYDAFGRRIAKHVWSQSNILVKSTYYILDAQGNQLSTYEHVVEDDESNYQLAERVMYGSSRLGINVNKVDMLDENPEELISLSLGNKLYEMSNHLGNVLTVINDIKVPISSVGIDVDGYLATIVSTADYSPFGVQLDGRTVSAETYRYGFQGQEKDDEIKGAGNSVNYTFRMHDPRLGRFFERDPLAPDYPWNSPYSFSENRVIDCAELEGLEKYYAADGSLIGQIGDNTTIRVLTSTSVSDAKKWIDWANGTAKVGRIQASQWNTKQANLMSVEMSSKLFNSIQDKSKLLGAVAQGLSKSSTFRQLAGEQPSSYSVVSHSGENSSYTELTSKTISIQQKSSTTDLIKELTWEFTNAKNTDAHNKVENDINKSREQYITDILLIEAEAAFNVALVSIDLNVDDEFKQVALDVNSGKATKDKALNHIANQLKQGIVNYEGKSMTAEQAYGTLYDQKKNKQEKK